MNAQTKTNVEKEFSFNTQQLIKDTGLIITQIKKSDGIAQTNIDSAMYLANQSLQSSLALQYKRGAAGSLLVLGTIYQLKGNYTRAISVMQQALNYCDTGMRARKMYVRICTFIGDAYWNKSQTDSSVYFYYKALDEIELRKMEDPLLLVDTYFKLTLLWINLNERHNSKNEVIDKYILNAEAYLDKVEKQILDNNDVMGVVYLSKGHIKRGRNDFDSARYYYRKYLQLQTKINNRHRTQILATLINISEGFLFQNKPDSAIYFAQQAMEDITPEEQGNSLYFTMANLYLGRAYNLQKQYTKAISVTEKALQLLTKNRFPYQYMAHEVLAEAYSATGRYEQAWQHQKQYADISDSLKKAENMQDISQMEMKYQVSERKKELAEKELILIKKDVSIQSRNGWITAITTGIFLLIIMAIVWYRQNQEKQRTASLHAQQELEIARLQANIDGEEKERNRLARELHDGIGGMLGSIQMQLGLAVKENTLPENRASFSNIQNLLAEAYADLRKTAHNLMPEMLGLLGLVNATRLYCEGMSKDSLEINFETVGNAPALPKEIQLAIYRIVQELVHNIVKHAQAKEALVQIAFLENKLSLTIEDDGIGMSVANTSQKKGMGIKTIAERVTTMGGKMDVTSSEGQGTSIYIEFNLNK